MPEGMREPAPAPKQPAQAVTKLLTSRRSLSVGRESGQAMVEYALITAGFLVGATVGWPYFVQLLNALNTYYRSIYYVIGSAAL